MIQALRGAWDLDGSTGETRSENERHQGRGHGSSVVAKASMTQSPVGVGRRGSREGGVSREYEEPSRKGWGGKRR